MYAKIDVPGPSIRTDAGQGRAMCSEGPGGIESNISAPGRRRPERVRVRRVFCFSEVSLSEVVLL